MHTTSFEMAQSLRDPVPDCRDQGRTIGQVSRAGCMKQHQWFWKTHTVDASSETIPRGVTYTRANHCPAKLSGHPVCGYAGMLGRASLIRKELDRRRFQHLHRAPSALDGLCSPLEIGNPPQS